MDAMRASQEDAPTTELVGGVVGDRCANCQAPLAPDQRYCVNCGERRGRPRFSQELMAAQAAPAGGEPPPPLVRGPRFSSGTTLVAGVATLLIALGVGVLIGHDSNSTAPIRASSPQVITVGAGTGTSSAGSGLGSTSSLNSNSSKGAKLHVTHVVVPAKAAKAATQAASKVLGKSKNLTPNVNQAIGGACSGGAGCQNGKYTGNYFPSG